MVNNLDRAGLPIGRILLVLLQAVHHAQRNCCRVWRQRRHHCPQPDFQRHRALCLAEGSCTYKIDTRVALLLLILAYT